MIDYNPHTRTLGRELGTYSAAKMTGRARHTHTLERELESFRRRCNGRGPLKDRSQG
jgi:hypothetical protein